MTADSGNSDCTSIFPVAHVTHIVDRTLADAASAHGWTVTDVGDWLQQKGMAALCPQFVAAGVDGPLLFGLTSDVLGEIGVTSLADCTRVQQHIELLRNTQLVNIKAFVVATSAFKRFQAVTTCSLASLRNLVEKVCFEEARMYDEMSYRDEDGDNIIINSDLGLTAALQSAAASGTCLKLRLANTDVPGKTHDLKLTTKG